MPIHDEEFIKRLRATFQVEAEEHLQAIATGLLVIEKAHSSAERQTAIENIYREAHSLKGAARAVDLADIESICQAMETVFAQWKRQPAAPSVEGFDILHKSVDAIRNLLDGTLASAPSQGRSRLLGQLAQLASDRPGTPIPLAPTVPQEPSPAKAVPPTGPDHTTGETVRIDAAKLDAQLLRAEELLPFKALMTQRAKELHDLLDRMERWHKQWARASAEATSIGSSDQRKSAVPAAEFLEWNVDFHRSFEQRLRTMVAQANRDQYHVSKRLDELLQDSKRLVMFPFSTLTGGFPKIVRDLCREQGKEAELAVHGADVEIDKRILEEMKDAIVHMLRNSVDHGIERPDERTRQGKPSSGKININVAPVNGSKVEMVVSDDGQGIDLEGVKESAVRRNLLSSTDAAVMPDAEALALIFRSEISTRKSVTTVSGRGLGMAIVQSKVEKLGGQLSIESKRGVGTKVRMVLPLTLATFRGILISAADQTFVVPAANVDRVLRIQPSEIRTVENRETVSIASEQGHVLSLVRLATVLDLPSPSRPPEVSAAIPVLILRAAGERIAFSVDEVLHEEEVLVKPLRKPLVRVRNIGGATILANGKAVPTLNVSDLIKSARLQPRAGSPPAASAPAKSSAKRILVVEDSITSRMLLKGILESAGYEVQVAVDGMEAFSRLRETECDLVVSDVEMPRLNGFDLTARIRADKRLAELPVVLVTALESRAQRERGLEVGANAYIVKSSFDQSNLLEVVRRLL
jgi:two-component system, chemotaxis family, sensor kinase CheA